MGPLAPLAELDRWRRSCEGHRDVDLSCLGLTDAQPLRLDLLLTHLRVLSLRDNRLADVLGLKGVAPALLELNLSQNRLRALPLHCPSLRALRASDNQLVTLGGLRAPKLERLEVPRNHLRTLEIEMLANLEVLDVSQNRLGTIAVFRPLSLLGRLRRVEVAGNGVAATWDARLAIAAFLPNAEAIDGTPVLRGRKSSYASRRAASHPPRVRSTLSPRVRDASPPRLRDVSPSRDASSSRDLSTPREPVPFVMRSTARSRARSAPRMRPRLLVHEEARPEAVPLRAPHLRIQAAIATKPHDREPAHSDALAPRRPRPQPATLVVSEQVLHAHQLLRDHSRRVGGWRADPAGTAPPGSAAPVVRPFVAPEVLPPRESERQAVTRLASRLAVAPANVEPSHGEIRTMLMRAIERKLALLDTLRGG